MNIFKSIHPYAIATEYKKPVAYFSMEYAIHQPLKIYSGSLGYIAGSYLRSAFALKQNVVGIGIFWKYGDYDQVRKSDQTMDVLFQEKEYHFLEEAALNFSVLINNTDVKVKAYYLPPEIFNTAPLYLLTTDIPENEYWAQSITHKLYDSNLELRTASKVLLGVGGAMLLEALHFSPEIYHINDTDALPLAFFLFNQHKNVEDVKKHLIYTNYSLEEPTLEKPEMYFLEKINYFNGIPLHVVKDITKNSSESFDQNLAALALAGLSNGLSLMHEEILKKMYNFVPGLSPITHITTGQNFEYWANHSMYKALKNNEDTALEGKKKYAKRKLFEEVAEQTGKIFAEDVFTLVWARKFTEFRRPDLLLTDQERFDNLISNEEFPVQIIFAGKPEPMDYAAISAFDKLEEWSKKHKNFTVLVGHDLKLAKLLKGGADLWLNTQRPMYEVSETSGISAAMNGSINLSAPDGWINEFCKHGKNCFIFEQDQPVLSSHEQELNEVKKLFDILEKKIIPLYYNERSKWLEIMKKSMDDIFPYFDSDRMVKEYYEILYNFSINDKPAFNKSEGFEINKK